MPSPGQRRTHARTNRRTTRKHNVSASSTGRAAALKLKILSRSYELSSESAIEPSITRYHIRCHQHLNRVATLPGETPRALLLPTLASGRRFFAQTSSSNARTCTSTRYPRGGFSCGQTSRELHTHTRLTALCPGLPG